MRPLVTPLRLFACMSPKRAVTDLGCVRERLKIKLL